MEKREKRKEDVYFAVLLLICIPFFSTPRLNLSFSPFGLNCLFPVLWPLLCVGSECRKDNEFQFITNKKKTHFQTMSLVVELGNAKL